MTSVSALGALIALVVAVLLILRKVPPLYGMLLGALIGGLLGGASLTDTVNFMIGGAQQITTAVMRILAAGVLAGVLIESGAASTIAECITEKLGETRALLALAIATLILTAVGVFVDVAVITVAPIALVLAQRCQLSRFAVLFAMVGGGKAGNLISPNPNAISAAENFHIPLTSVMAAGIVPMLVGLLCTYWLAKRLMHKGSQVNAIELAHNHIERPPAFFTAMSAPLVAILLLALNPLFAVQIDPLIALPAGGLVGALCMGKIGKINDYVLSGLAKMAPVAIMLLGTGALAGIIANSQLTHLLIDYLQASGLPAYLLAPISGLLMSLATSSTTAATAVATSVFNTPLTELGVGAVAGAAMIHAGATVFDHLPHGSFFHATGGSMNMIMQERLRLIPYECAIGLVMTLVSTLIFGVFGN